MYPALKKHFKFIMPIILACVASLSLFLIFQFQIQKVIEKDIQTDLTEIQQNAVYLLELEFNEFIRSVEAEARTISMISDLTTEQLQQELKNFPKSPSLLRAHVLTLDGIYYSSTDSEIRKYNPKDYENSLQTKGTVVSKPRYSNTFNKMVVEVATPLYINNKYAGIFVGCYDNKVFERLMLNNFLKGDCSIYVTSSDGELIFSNATNSQISNNIKNPFLSFSPSNADFIINSSENITNDIMNKKSGFAYLKYSNAKRYLCYAPVNIRDWYLFTVATEKTFTQQTTPIKSEAFKMVIGIIIILILLAVIITKIRSKEYRIQKKFLQKVAETDALTNLDNRFSIEKKIKNFLCNEGEKGKHALFMIDIDGFKFINDNLGHIKGDEILQEFGETFSGFFKNDEFVGRIGGDEFIALIPNFNKIDDISSIAQRLCDTLYKQHIYDKDSNITIVTSASIGIAIYDKDGRDFEELYNKADIALYKSKDNGKNNFQFFSEDIEYNGME